MEKKQVYKAIAEAVGLICKRPGLYFSESDVQFIFNRELEKRLKKKYYETGVPLGFNKGKKSKYGYKTTLIHREYGVGQWRRADIVIFNPQKVKMIENLRRLMTANERYLKPDYIFEFGTDKSGIVDHVKKDLIKLHDIDCDDTKESFLIHFERNEIKSDKGSRHEENEKKVSKIIQKLEKVIKKKNSKKIRVIICIITIGNKNYRDGSKLKILVDNNLKENFEKIALKNIKKVIIKNLNKL